MIVPLMMIALQAATAATPHKERKPTDMICKELPVMGSRLDERRVCMTRLQWDDTRRDARETVDQAQTRQTNPH
jgi:hypothetical protein